MRREIALKSLATIVYPLSAVTAGAGSDRLAEDTLLSAAICPIVYPLDQFRSAEGFRYTFFGNAFFINEAGYLLTAGHVLKAFRNGGQPYILVSQRAGARQLLPAVLVAVDWEHDVAVLRAAPNPFEGNYKVAFLPLAMHRASRGTAVLSLTLRPPRLLATHLFEAPLEERSVGEVLDSQFTQLGSAWQDTELLLFSQQVLPGQSGAPLLLADSLEVVGILAGRWLRNALPYVTTVQTLAPSPGAALRIHYAIRLLREQRISWHAIPGASDRRESAVGLVKQVSPPIPLSLVAPPYPPQTLFGNEVLLDALIDTDGRLVDLRVVRGEELFLEKALTAVRTWSFLPARVDDRAVEARLGIVFQFPQPRLQSAAPLARRHEQFLRDLTDRGALPAVTREPQYPPISLAKGSVVIYTVVDPQGQITSVHVLHELESLTPAVVAAVRRWRFLPAREAGAELGSAAVVVVTFRRPVLAIPVRQRSPE